MRSIKIITAIISFSATFILSVFIASLFVTTATTVSTVTVAPYRHKCSKSGYAENITRFIQQDIRNGETRMRRLYRLKGWDKSQFSSSAFAAQAQAVSDYSAASSAMSDNHLPSDFRAAWRKHMKAWRDFSNFLDEVKTSGDAEVDFDALENEHNEEINTTWYEVLRIGRNYGADVGY